MKDVQSQPDTRNIPIDKVGIKNLRYPITVLDRREGRQATVASINMYVDLPHNYKGTHMSRFVEMLHLLKTEISLKRFAELLEQMKMHLNAASAHIEITFPYFIEKKAPVSRSARAHGLYLSHHRLQRLQKPGRPDVGGQRAGQFGLPVFQGDQR